MLAGRSIGLSQVGALADRVVWNEARPNEAGRQVLVAATAAVDGASEDLLPEGFSARTQVHEYGGRCWTAVGDAVVASNWQDQRLWRFARGVPPEPLTAEPPLPKSVRFADPIATPDSGFLIAVREQHRAEGVENDLVALSLERPGEPLVLASGRDFFSSPAVSPDGRSLAWLCWDHPNMPWDDTELWLAEIGPGLELSAPRRVAGAAGESIQQPRWSPEGVLHFVSDRSGWWNLYADGEPLCPMEAEFGLPGWAFGTASYAFTSDGRLVAAWSGPDGSGIGTVAGGTMTPFELPYSSFTSLAAVGELIACIASSPDEAPAVVAVDASGWLEVLRSSRDFELDSGFLSTPERVRFPTAGGEEAFALVYPPTSATHEGRPGELPPLLAMVHGGPTSAASSALNLGVQYFTSRGFAVADVDYRGSTGYGREFRKRLRGNWGVCDVEDCAAAARWLAAAGRVDPSRCVIRGGSAGGLTTMLALALTDAFAAGSSHYGVADLAGLDDGGHKFESRYNETMIGPMPEAEQRYRERSPVHHLDGFNRPLILFQGLEDVIVPPAQSEAVYRGLLARGVPVAYLSFEGEQHGWRRAETIGTVATVELSFFGRVLGFLPDGAVEVRIDNLDPPA